MPDSPAHHVRRWREAVGQPCADVPSTDVAAEDFTLARAMIREEHAELGSVLAIAQHVTQGDRALPAIAQEMADLVWVVYGAAELLGIDLDRAISEVAAANMRKVQGGVRRRADGKVLKPDGWVGPDMARCIQDMRALGRGGVKP
jgi:predicted HAD superfamily Cof-like phosphohydrolase